MGLLLGLDTPLLAIQLIWLNLVTDGLQDMALSFERETDTIMKNKPRKVNENIFEKNLIEQILISGLFIGGIVFIIWWILINEVKMDATIARGYVLALMVFMQNIHVINCRSESKNLLEMNFKQNKFILFTIAVSIILQILVMEVPFLSNLLQTQSISYLHLILLLCVSIPILFVMEAYKQFKKRK